MKYRYTIFHDGEDVKVTRHDPGPKWSLEQLQKAVGGGHIEPLPRPIAQELVGLSPQARVYANEEGKFRDDFKDNFHFNVVHNAGGSIWVDPVRGPVVVEETVKPT